MIILSKQQKDNFKVVFYSTIIWGMIAHAFVYLNVEYTHDSLMVVSTDNIWQISLGRFLQPIYRIFRGRVNAPWLIGILSLLFLAISIWLMVDLFNIRNRIYAIAISGICVTNVSIICMNATYIPWADIFALALLLAVTSAWMTFRFRYGYLLGAITLFLSMALYQSYLTVFITLAMLYAIYSILDNKLFIDTAKNILRSILCAAISALLYKLGTVAMLKIANTSLSESYNGISHVGDYSNVQILSLVKDTYVYFLKSFLIGNTRQNGTVLVINWMLLVITFIVALRFFSNRYIRWSNIIPLLGICAVYPFGSNLIYFISKGFAYELMTYSFFLVYLAPFIVLSLLEQKDQTAELNIRAPKKQNYIEFARILICTGCIILVVNNTILANQSYTKKKLVYDSTQNTVTRILSHIEETEGYVPNVTPVLFIGNLQNNSIFRGCYSEFDNLDNITGLNSDIAITYDATQNNFFKYIMNTKVKILPQKDVELISDQKQIDEMPAFPQHGSCKMIDGVMVVKLSQK